jgi:hypothetical protein
MGFIDGAPAVRLCKRTKSYSPTELNQQTQVSESGDNKIWQTRFLIDARRK